MKVFNIITKVLIMCTKCHIANTTIHLKYNHEIANTNVAKLNHSICTHRPVLSLHKIWSGDPVHHRMPHMTAPECDNDASQTPP